MNEQEQAEYDELKAIHAMAKALNMPDADIVKIAKTAGVYTDAAMKQYCADYGVKV